MQALQNITVQVWNWLRTQHCGIVVLHVGRRIKIIFIAFKHRLVRNDTADCSNCHWVSSGHQSPQPPPFQSMNRRKELPMIVPGRNIVPKCSLYRQLHQPQQHFSHVLAFWVLLLTNSLPSSLTALSHYTPLPSYSLPWIQTQGPLTYNACSFYSWTFVRHSKVAFPYMTC